MNANFVQVWLKNNTGFTLPFTINELSNDITKLKLDYCSLTGACFAESPTQTEISPHAGSIPSELGNLTKLTHLQLENNQLTGAFLYSTRSTQSDSN